MDSKDAADLAEELTNLKRDTKMASSASSSKYLICDVKYDLDGKLIRYANGDPKEFCNRHDTQISAMLDRCISSAEKLQLQATIKNNPAPDKNYCAIL
jgi:hypothetical protein